MPIAIPLAIASLFGAGVSFMEAKKAEKKMERANQNALDATERGRARSLNEYDTMRITGGETKKKTNPSEAIVNTPSQQREQTFEQDSPFLSFNQPQTMQNPNMTAPLLGNQPPPQLYGNYLPRQIPQQFM